jgi:hypothetical protein
VDVNDGNLHLTTPIVHLQAEGVAINPDHRAEYDAFAPGLAEPTSSIGNQESLQLVTDARSRTVSTQMTFRARVETYDAAYLRKASEESTLVN